MLHNAVRPKSKSERKNKMLVYTDDATISFFWRRKSLGNQDYLIITFLNALNSLSFTFRH